MTFHRVYCAQQYGWWATLFPIRTDDALNDGAQWLEVEITVLIKGPTDCCVALLLDILITILVDSSEQIILLISSCEFQND